MQTPSVFTTFASSRFIDREAVRASLRRCAQRLRATRPDVRAVYLFGSFATGRATPRSDADIVVEIAPGDPESRRHVHDLARTLFLEAPIPVDLFVLSSAHMTTDRGVAGAVQREGLRLA